LRTHIKVVPKVREFYYFSFHAPTSAEAQNWHFYFSWIYRWSQHHFIINNFNLFAPPVNMRSSNYSNYSHCSFFTFIYNTFGLHIVILLKKWIRHNKELIKITARNKYLLLCKRSNIFPKHLNYYHTSRFTFHNELSFRKADRFFNRFSSQILNLEIADNCKHRKKLLSSIYRLTRSIENNLPCYICKKFFYTQFFTKIIFK